MAAYCNECATPHDPKFPHELDSLYYQLTFYAKHGHGPTWRDAMDHCTDDVKAEWCLLLTEKGEDLDRER